MNVFLFGACFPSFGQSSSFSPSDLANLRIWLKADAGVYKPGGNDVGTWTNQAPCSGCNSEQLASTGTEDKGNRPTEAFGINAQRTIRFDGSGENSVLRSPLIDLSGVNDMTLFVVARPDDVQLPSATIVDHNYSGTVSPPTGLQPTGAFSRQTHGSAGTFDIPLPLSATPGVECRSSGGIYKMVITFPSNVAYTSVTVTGTAQVAGSSGGVNSPVTVDLTGVADKQTIAITLHNLTDGTQINDVMVLMTLVVGDVTGNGSVNSGDIGQVAAASGQTANGSNFRDDLNVSGVINSGDLGVVKASSGSSPASFPAGFSLLRRNTTSNVYQFLFGGEGMSQGLAANATAPVQSNRSQILCVTKEGLKQTLTVNQTQTGAAPVASTITEGAKVFSVGGASNTGLTRFFKGHIGEIILYTGALSPTDRQSVIDYLNAKFAVSAPAPIPLPGLRAWFRADAGIVKDSTGRVNLWTDQVSGIAVNPTTDAQGSPILQPSWTSTGAAGEPSIHFDGTTLLTTNPGNGVDLQGESDNTSVFVVLKPNATQQPEAFVFDQDFSLSNGFGLSSSTGNSYHFRFHDPNANVFGANPSSALSTQLTVLSVVKDGVTQSLFVNGTPSGSASVSDTMQTGINDLAIGGGAAAGSSRFNGDIAQILIYNRAVDQAERNRIESYLMTKYGLAGTRFTFTLDAAYPTTAGVFDTSTGSLIRTLWRNETYGPGAYTKSWDGVDDDGVLRTTGNYQVRVLFHNTEYVFDGAIGNTSVNNVAPGYGIFSGDQIYSMSIAGNAAFLASGTDEGRTSLHYMDLASLQQKDIGFADAALSFEHAATDGQRVYFACRPNGAVFPESLFAAFVTSLDGAPPFNEIQSSDFFQDVSVNSNQYHQTWTHCLDVTTVPAIGDDASGNNPSFDLVTSAAATGLAVQKNGPLLAVAHGPQNEVRFFDKNTGQPKNYSPLLVAAPKVMAFAPNGDLWVISGTGVKRFSFSAGTPQEVSGITGTTGPVAVATDANNNVFVADGGNSQVVKVFTSTGQQISGRIYGQPGGWFAADATPDVVNTPAGYRFGFKILGSANRAALAVADDETGSFWIGDSATQRLLHLAPDATFLNQVAYISLSRNINANADANNPNRVFGNAFLEYQVDYSLPLSDPGSWILKKNWACGPSFAALGKYLGPGAADDDVKGGLPGLRQVATLSNGRTYALVADFSIPDQNSTGHALNKLVELQGPVPAGSPAGLRDTGQSAPRIPVQDSNPGQPRVPVFTGSGALLYSKIDTSARGRFYRRNITSIVANNPIWEQTGTVIASAPVVDTDPFSNREESFDPSYAITSSNILVSLKEFNKQTPLAGGESIWATGFHLGGLPLGGDLNRWAWKASPSVTTDIPFDGLGSFDLGDAVQYPGGMVAAVGRHIIYSYPGEFWNQTQASQWMHYYDDGLFVGQFGTSGNNSDGQLSAPNGANNATPVPGFAGYSGFLSMVSANGETFIWANDQNNYYGLVRWHIKGVNTVRELQGPLNLQSTSIIPTAPATYPTGLSANPGNGSVSLSWNPVPGASYIVSYSISKGGPYSTLGTTTSANFLDVSAQNGARRYYVISTSNNPSVFSNEVAAIPFTQVEKAGQLIGGVRTSWNISTSEVLKGRAALRLDSVVGDLIRPNVGAGGYVIFNWHGVSTTGIGNDYRYLAPGFSVTKDNNWGNQEKFLNNRFLIDNEAGEYAGLYVPGATPQAGENASIAITVPQGDTNVHYLTVICPVRTEYNIRGWSVALQGASGEPATYMANPGNDQRVFQFEFKGNVTLNFTNLLNSHANGDSGSGWLQAILLD